MASTAILDDILKELKRAKKKHPNWPDHIVARAAIVGEEAGELIRAALNYKYDHIGCSSDESMDQMKKEAVQTAAMCIRFLETINK
jgi:NTP pyrophosphatase (non-canonical NTP hydrolase)